MPGSNSQSRVRLADFITDSLAAPTSILVQLAAVALITGSQALLNHLTEHSVNAEELSVHTPDLDDVFLALTGHHDAKENAR